MLKILDHFENIIVYALAGLMAVAIFFSTLDLAVNLFKDLFAPPVLLIQTSDLLDLFGLFLLVLLGLELLETVKSYIREHVIHVEVVMVVAIIAIARKAIILDFKDLPGMTLLGLAAVLGALAFGYVHIKGSHCPPSPRADRGGTEKS